MVNYLDLLIHFEIIGITWIILTFLIIYTLQTDIHTKTHIHEIRYTLLIDILKQKLQYCIFLIIYTNIQKHSHTQIFTAMEIFTQKS